MVQIHRVKIIVLWAKICGTLMNSGEAGYAQLAVLNPNASLVCIQPLGGLE